MSFFAKKHEAPAYCRPGGLAPGYPGYPGDGLVPMPWPAECVPAPCGVISQPDCMADCYPHTMQCAAGEAAYRAPLHNASGFGDDEGLRVKNNAEGGSLGLPQDMKLGLPRFKQAKLRGSRQKPAAEAADGASSEIQAVARGKAERKELHARAEEEAREREAQQGAAVKIQAVARGKAERKELHARAEEEAREREAQQRDSAQKPGGEAADGASSESANLSREKANTPTLTHTKVSPSDLTKISVFICEACVDDCGFLDPLVLDCSEVSDDGLVSSLQELAPSASKLIRQSQEPTIFKVPQAASAGHGASVYADVSFFDMRDADDACWNRLPTTRQLQKRGVRWVLLCVSKGTQEYQRAVNGKVHQHFHRGHTAEGLQSFNMLMISLNWPEYWQKGGSDPVHLPNVNKIGNKNPFDTYNEQLGYLKRVFSVTNTEKAGVYPLDMREFLQHPKRRVKYSDRLGFRLRNGQAKLLDRSLFTVLFSAFRYIEMRRQEAAKTEGSIDEAKELEHVLKHMVLVYVGGGAPNPNSKRQHFTRLMELIPHFKIVSYDVNRAQFEENDHTKGRFHVVQKMLDESEIQLLKNTMEAEMQEPLATRTWFAVCGDPRSDIERRIEELNAALAVEKDLLYLMKDANLAKNDAKFKQYMKWYEQIRAGKLKLRETLEETIKKDNFFQYELGNTLVNYTLAICGKITAPSLPNLKFWAPACALLKQDKYQGLEHTSLMTKGLSQFTLLSQTERKDMHKQRVKWWGTFIKNTSPASAAAGVPESLQTFKTNEIVFKTLVPEKDTESFLQEYGSTPIDEAYAYCTLKTGFHGEGIGSGMRHLLSNMFRKFANLMHRPTDGYDRIASEDIEYAQQKKHSNVHKIVVKDVEDLEQQNLDPDNEENVKFIKEFVCKYVYGNQNRENALAKLAESLEPFNSLEGYNQKYAEQAKQSIFVFDKATRRTLLHLSLYSSADIEKGIDAFLATGPLDAESKKQKMRMLGTLLLSLMQTFHKVRHEENLPHVRECLLKYVTEIEHWPGSCSATTYEDFMARIKQVYEIESLGAIQWERVARDVYCNMLLPFVTNEHLCKIFCKSTDALFQVFKWYFDPNKNERTALSWRSFGQIPPNTQPGVSQARKPLTNYPGNKTWCELALQHDVWQLLPLIAGRVVDHEGTRKLLDPTPQDLYDVLGGTFSKGDSQYLKPLHIAVYYGNVETVRWILSTVKEQTWNGIYEMKRNEQNRQQFDRVYVEPWKVLLRLLDAVKVQTYHGEKCEETPLLVACKRRATKDMRDDKAIYYEIVQMLLDANAKAGKDLKVISNNGDETHTTPLTYVQEQGDTDIEQLMEEYSTKRSLHGRKAPSSGANARGYTPLPLQPRTVVPNAAAAVEPRGQGAGVARKVVDETPRSTMSRSPVVSEQRPYSSKPAPKSFFAMSPLQKAERTFRDDLFPEQAMDHGESLNGSKFTDIIQILENLIELKDLMLKYRPVDASEKNNIEIKLTKVSSDLKEYLDMVRLRYTVTSFIEQLEPKERDDVYWAVLNEDKSKLQEYDFNAKFKRATGFEIDDKQGLDPTLTEFEVFKIRLKTAISALRTAFRETL